MTADLDRVSARNRATTHGAAAALGALALATLTSVVTIPLLTPLVGSVGGVASILVAGQRRPSRLRWTPLVVFVAIISISLFVEVPRLHLAGVLGHWQ